jgi:hypothetical protein
MLKWLKIKLKKFTKRLIQGLKFVHLEGHSLMSCPFLISDMAPNYIKGLWSKLNQITTLILAKVFDLHFSIGYNCIMVLWSIYYKLNKTFNGFNWL